MYYYAKSKGNCKELKVFERNKIPLEVKIFGIATYIQTSSVRRIARILSELYSVLKTSIWNWIKKFKGKLLITTERERRSLVEID